MEEEDDVMVIQLQVCSGLGKLIETTHEDGTTTTSFERGKEPVESVKDILRYVLVSFPPPHTPPECQTSSK